MSIEHNKAIRGRPKKLDRDAVIQTALMCYWADGPTEVSINEVCQKSGASKPGVYREFGSDDGLKAAALETYAQLVLTPLYEVLNKDQSFENTVEELIHFTIQDREVLGIPNGCLQMAMRTQYHELGSLTRKRIDQIKNNTLEKYQNLIDRAKEKKQINSELSTETIALYFDAQNGSAMRLQKEGLDNAVIKVLLVTAFTAFLR